MSENLLSAEIWENIPLDMTSEVNFIQGTANKLLGYYMPGKYWGCCHFENYNYKVFILNQKDTLNKLTIGCFINKINKQNCLFNFANTFS